MRLFRRKTKREPEPGRCPMCTERISESAEHCSMCGADLKVLRARRQSRQTVRAQH